MDQEKTISPRQNVKGEIRVPGSKSYAQRAIALSALSAERITLTQLTECDDVNVALKIIEDFGVSILRDEDLVHIEGEINRTSEQSINCGEAGLSTRLFSTFSLLTDKKIEVNGSGSILVRPMDMVVDSLHQMGKTVESKEGRLPLKISGKTIPGKLKIDGSTSSQLLTGILIVAPFLDFDLTIEVENLKSIPYIDMTLEVIRDFGLTVEHEDYKVFNVKGNQSVKSATKYNVEGDWSGASFLIVAGLIGGPLKLKGLKKQSLQGDKSILEVVERVGGGCHWKENDLYISSGKLSSFSFDATHCPDLFPPLVALAAMIEGESRIRGVHRLKHKESDRATALIKEFHKLGIAIFKEDDELVINGLKNGAYVKGGLVDSHNDHRMAMALALMSLRSNGQILIQNPQSIKKSYPLFFEDFEQITDEKYIS